MARKRFNRVAICSSSNYEVSKKAHINFIREEHSKSNLALNIVSKTKKAYTKCFGKLIPLSKIEASRYDSLNIIYM